ncbi:hypothetical protein [Paenibacillus aquistagni]|uniref:Uncharacterized protein n=1 Tax=Paenibacillus aquistagni TaxID=1852522 RepID=A0A1X7JH21_9BACL|nr:hypothetical protein [Paenibacillus aquistagni]SMG26972.1 hypothetical protein SAMN06295960_1554 [Paenibacillus aquistagni]
MELHIQEANMTKNADQSLQGNVVFRLEGYQFPYEISFFSKKGRDWDYSLHFTSESGDEEEFLKLDQRLTDDDDLFDALLDAALEQESEQ